MVQFSVLVCLHHFLLELWQNQSSYGSFSTDQDKTIRLQAYNPGAHTPHGILSQKNMAQGFTVVWCSGKHHPEQPGSPNQCSAADRMVYIGLGLVQEFFQDWL